MFQPDEAAIQLSADAAQAYLKACDPNAPVCLGVLTNPGARQNRLRPIHPRLLRLVQDPHNVIQTVDSLSLRSALSYLLFKRRINVLAVNGGDGTIHTVVNALWELLDEVSAQTGLDCPAPRILMLNGGTMNMASRAMNTRGGAVRTVQWFIDRYSQMTLQQIQVRRVNLLEANDTESRTRRLGFIFGTELVRNALWMYSQLGEGYPGLSRLLFYASVGYVFNTPLWKHYGPLLTAPRSAAVIDDVAYAPYGAALATSIDMTLLKGWVQTAHVPEGASGFHVKLILATDPGDLFALVPTLMSQRRSKRVLEAAEVSTFRVKGAYTIDGELFGPPPGGPQGTSDVEVSVCGRPLLAVHNDDKS